ncbi:MAG TPA: M48 family metallopeptidase [Alphaproteobacteria bacterium]|nr:M48 family metallopeptidase [Alphaproteobacteria bacterium]USO05146.1 MAG: M48 family metallopeptidase [Rhodospirillales bacterium]HOO82395.1 M48 family metallopeptidase [Alphaproteobacteria bacterium]
MPIAVAGLQTHIWNNNAKSMMLLALYPLLIIGMIWLLSFASGYIYYGGNIHSYDGIMNGQTPWGHQDTTLQSPTAAVNLANYIVINNLWLIFTVIFGWFAISWFFHTKMIRKLAHSRPVTRKEEPALYNLLENLSITAGITMPKLEIIETHARNAFASGIDEKSYTITVTRGLLNMLSKNELEGVLAHELTHIINRDVRLLIVTVIFAGMIGFFAQLVWSNLRYSFIFSRHERRSGKGLLIMIVLVAVLWVGYLLTLSTRFALSRRREYMADAGAVQLTKKPESMMRALLRIAQRDQIPETTDDIMMMCIENSNPFMGLFATHPPIEKRIQILSEMTNTPVPQITTLSAEKEKRIEHVKKNPWLTRGRRKP